MVEKIINNRRTTTQGFEDLYPFEPRCLNIEGHRLSYVDKGRGKPVIMVHGNPTWSFFFRKLVNDLSEEYRAIAPDHIGCGFSDKPGPGNYDYTLKNRVRDFDLLIRHLEVKGKISLVLHDWGGIIGLAWALDNLERTDKIILSNTSGFLMPKGRKLFFLLRILKYVSWFAVPAVLGFNMFSKGALYLGSEKKLPGKVKKGLVAPYNSWNNRIAILKFIQDIPVDEKDQSFDFVRKVDRNLKKLEDSCLMFLWGAKDFIFDLSFLREFKQRFPGAETFVFNDAGHYLFEDKPDETASLIRKFLKK